MEVEDLDVLVAAFSEVLVESVLELRIRSTVRETILAEEIRELTSTADIEEVEVVIMTFDFCLWLLHLFLYVPVLLRLVICPLCSCC